MTELNTEEQFYATINKIRADRERLFDEFYEANKTTLGNLEKFSVRLIWDYGCNSGMKISNSVFAPKED